MLSTRHILVRDPTVTSQKAQIQALLNGIDEALSKTSPRLPWVMSSDAMQQRQILEQTRQYLVSLQQQLDAEPPSMLSEAAMAPGMASATQSPSESAQQVLQAVLQEMNYWRVNMLQPLRAEVDSLQRQREMLTQEIRQLEAQRYQYGLSQQAQVQNQQVLMEFLQSAMAQMQANLSGQVTQMVAGLSAQSPAQLPAQTEANSSTAGLSPAERLAQMQQMQAQSDHLMLKLDSTLQVIFESLNRNVQTYQESLEQGLNRMHNLGQQGEAMFAFLVNRLAQQLGREASSFLQSSTPDWPSSQTALPGQDQSSDASFTVADFLSQVSEPPQASPSFTPAVPFNLSEEVLDVAELDQTDEMVESSSLDGLDLELNQLDLSALPSETEATEPFDLFAGDQPLSTSDAANPAPVDSGANPSVTSDLDSALDLLNQLSAEMQAGLLDDAPVQPSASEVELSHEPELITTPDSLYNDDFYNNLFEEPEAKPAPTAPEETSINALTLEQEWFGGLADPAVQAEIQPTQPEAPTSPVSQSLETFLLTNPTAASDLPEKSADLFVSFPSASAQDAASEPVETIVSLTELVPDPASETFASSRPASSEPQQPTQEAMLPITEAATETLNVNLGVDTLEHLGEDLVQSTAQSTEPSQDWDLFANIPPVEAPQPPAESTSLTIEGLEELFEDLPNTVASAEPTSSVGDATFRFGDMQATRPPVPPEDTDSSEKKKT